MYFPSDYRSVRNHMKDCTQHERTVTGKRAPGFLLFPSPFFLMSSFVLLLFLSLRLEVVFSLSRSLCVRVFFFLRSLFLSLCVHVSLSVPSCVHVFVCTHVSLLPVSVPACVPLSVSDASNMP